MLILGNGSTIGIDNSKITTVDKSSMNFAETKKKICWSPHYTGRNSFCMLIVLKRMGY